MMDKKKVISRTRMALSEIMTILIMFHLSGYRTFKWYYKKHVMQHQKKDFPNLVSYNRFVEIMEYALVPLILYLSSVPESLLWIPHQSKYVTIIASEPIVYSVNMQKEEKVPWDGSMASNCT